MVRGAEYPADDAGLRARDPDRYAQVVLGGGRRGPGIRRRRSLSGQLFVFFNRRQTMMKSIYWDGGGYCLMAKQLARGTFVLPTANERGVVELEASELALILDGIDLSNARRRPRWERAEQWSTVT
ncbi:MAG: IS66 family insertion sequence element accessory protein TnpB [Myxococcota bacterium]